MMSLPVTKEVNVPNLGGLSANLFKEMPVSIDPTGLIKNKDK